MSKKSSVFLVYFGLAVAVILIISAFSFAYGNADSRWRNGYSSGYEEGWQAAYIHIAEGGE